MFVSANFAEETRVHLFCDGFQFCAINPVLGENSARVRAVLEPIRDHCAVDFQMKLKTVYVVLITISLVRHVGPARKKALLRRFGSLARLREATLEEISQTPGVGPEIASAIAEKLHGPGEQSRRESA